MPDPYPKPVWKKKKKGTLTLAESDWELMDSLAPRLVAVLPGAPRPSRPTVVEHALRHLDKWISKQEAR